MGDYESGHLAAQIVAIVASIFIFGLQIAIFAEAGKVLLNIHLALGACFIIGAVVTILMELPKQLNVEGLQGRVVKILSQYKDPITRGTGYIIQGVLVCCYFSEPIDIYVMKNPKAYNFAVAYMVAGVLLIVAGIVGIILKVIKK